MHIAAVQVGRITIGAGHPLAFIAGPCVIESRDHVMRMADELGRICRRLHVGLIFKASFDKANRSSVDSFRGPGLEKACEYFNEIRRELDLPVTTDIHLPDQAAPIAEAIDVLQIPAFLCRQTDLLAAAAATGKVVNIKKGQFMSPEEMGNAAAKVVAVGNRNVLLTERGTFFGYHRLVNDLTALPRMQRFAPVVFDATHSCQQPGAQGTQSGGSREFLRPLALAAVAAGADALFCEVHDNPAQAKSDAATQMPLEQFEDFVTRCLRVREAVVRE
jgi:2-dehydro-3-deoxyphosphooctonate aldolase (KDO 8-P synthase)